MEKISELQTKRAVNIIWTAAGRHDFTPDFKAYNEAGEADIYWNCIIGAVRLHYDYPQFESIFRAFRNMRTRTLMKVFYGWGLKTAFISTK